MPILASTLDSSLKSPFQVWATWLKHSCKAIPNISFNAYPKKSIAYKKKHELKTYYYAQNGNQGDLLLIRMEIKLTYDYL
jgi:hypothetical protein